MHDNLKILGWRAMDDRPAGHWQFNPAINSSRDGRPFLKVMLMHRVASSSTIDNAGAELEIAFACVFVIAGSCSMESIGSSGSSHRDTHLITDHGFNKICEH